MYVHIKKCIDLRKTECERNVRVNEKDRKKMRIIDEQKREHCCQMHAQDRSLSRDILLMTDAFRRGIHTRYYYTRVGK